MLWSPRSFRMKVNGSFYPPSSSGVGTLPTRPDKPSPRRTLRSDTPTQLARVEVTSAPNTATQTQLGVSDRSAQDLAMRRVTVSGLHAGHDLRRRSATVCPT